MSNNLKKILSKLNTSKLNSLYSYEDYLPTNAKILEEVISIIIRSNIPWEDELENGLADEIELKLRITLLKAQRTKKTILNTEKKITQECLEKLNEKLIEIPKRRFIDIFPTIKINEICEKICTDFDQGIRNNIEEGLRQKKDFLNKRITLVKSKEIEEFQEIFNNKEFSKVLLSYRSLLVFYVHSKICT